MPDGHLVQLSASEMIGLGGALVYSVSYLLAAYDLLPSQSPLYYMSKLVAAAMVLISLSQNFNLASAVIQVFFITVSLIGIYRHLDAHNREQRLARANPAAQSSGT